MDRADRWIGLSDGGSGLEDRLRENFPRVEVIILDFFHPAEKLTGLARLLHPGDEERAEDQARGWCRLLKEEGGAVLAVVLREWDWPRRAGLSEAADELIGYLERHAHRMEYPEYLAHGWCIGSGAVESACKTVVGQRLKLAGMAGGKMEPMPSATCVPSTAAKKASGRPSGTAISPATDRLYHQLK